ncbi:hypothetical protein UFOVP1040_81 [uncultured Caudovirales phage]|uniref:Uncharacterized protein n=1 Tax=uncultured Caudovirales phage TaxID=2100421 RepID=A0A6J5QGF2_9CAUD|nr:hypothetical protein UFOVP1040_81 [uncultured Caudovirales phage]
MTGKYDSAAKTALSLISRKGATINLRRKTAASFDPVAQTGAVGTETTYAFKGVAVPPGKSAEARVGSLVDRRMVEVYFALKGMAVVPENGDVITVGGAEYTIFWAATLDPAGDGPVLSTCYAE